MCKDKEIGSNGFVITRDPPRWSQSESLFNAEVNLFSPSFLFFLISQQFQGGKFWHSINRNFSQLSRLRGSFPVGLNNAAKLINTQTIGRFSSSSFSSSGFCSPFAKLVSNIISLELSSETKPSLSLPLFAAEPIFE